MLRRTPSLALRAGLIFMSIYTLIFVAAVIVAMHSTSTDDSGSNRHRGAHAAAGFAAGELRPVGGSLALPGDGDFGRLAAKNPSLWLVARHGGRAITFGPVPETAVELLDRYGAAIDSARFQIPNTRGALGSAAMRRYDYGSEPLVVIAGGVDPGTLTVRDSIRSFGPEDALMAVLTIALLGFLPMLVALPFFARAIRPIAAEAATLRPEKPDRRLDERKAPRELLPLVRAFNATLERLAGELGRRKRFIADAAHELRTPLAVVSLRVEALEDQAAKQELRRGVDQLVHLVSQMLDLERLSLSGRERSPVDLAAIARDAAADLAPAAIKAGYELSLDAPDEPVIVHGDPYAISRAITNLIANAIAHGGGAGNIKVVVSANRTIEVADEGPGVPAALEARIFEPFFRGSQNEQGRGLGLHLTREIMRANGGEVTLATAQPGATFTLRFGRSE